MQREKKAMKKVIFILLSAITMCRFEYTEASKTPVMKRLQRETDCLQETSRNLAEAREPVVKKRELKPNAKDILLKHGFTQRAHTEEGRCLFHNTRQYKEVACLVDTNETVLVSGIIVRRTRYTIDNSPLIKTLRSEGVDVMMRPSPLYDPSEVEAWVQESQRTRPSDEADAWRVLTIEEIFSLKRFANSTLAAFPSYRFGIIKKSETENLQKWMKSQDISSVSTYNRSMSIELTFNERQNNIGNNVMALLRVGVPYQIIEQNYDMVEIFLQNLPRNLAQFFSETALDFPTVKEIWTLLRSGIPFKLIEEDYENVHKFLSPIFFYANELALDEKEQIRENLKQNIFRQGTVKALDAWRDIVDQLKEMEDSATLGGQNQTIIRALKLWNSFYH